MAPDVLFFLPFMGIFHLIIIVIIINIILFFKPDDLVRASKGQAKAPDYQSFKAIWTWFFYKVCGHILVYDTVLGTVPTIDFMGC